MKNKIFLLITIGIAALLFGVSYYAVNLMPKDSYSKIDEIKNSAPKSAANPSPSSIKTNSDQANLDISLENEAGETVLLSQYIKDKKAVVNFWASWCGPCAMEMPHFLKLEEEYGEGIVFVMINLTDGNQETKEQAQEFLDKNKYTFKNVLYDTKLEGAYAYAVRFIPLTVLIDENGTVVSKINSTLSEESLRDAIKLFDSAK